MGIMQKILCLLCTKYGKVINGKHNGCGMAIGSDDTKNVSVDVKWTKLMFIKGSKMMEEVRIETLKACKVLNQTEKATTILLTFADGETSTVSLPAVDAQGKPFVNDRVGLVLGALSSVPTEA